MKKTVKITSKRQITIPAAIYKELNLNKGASLVMETGPGYLQITPARQIAAELAGSLPLPKRFHGLSDESIVEKAKNEYFRKKYKK